jgi:hypothetical protein
MRSKLSLIAVCVATAFSSLIAQTQQPARPLADPLPPLSPTVYDEGIKTLVGRLEVEKYKATIKGLTQFGDRRQGTDRNRAAVDWIEAQLKSYGCPTERDQVRYNPPPPIGAAARWRRAGRGAAADGAGWRPPRGIRTATGVNTDPMAQPDEKLRALNMQPTTPGRARSVLHQGRHHPSREMYIVGGHMDGHGWGEAANDDGSGTALVMELARVFSMPTCRPSARFASRCGTTRRTGSQRRARLHRAASGAAGQGEPARVRQISGAEVARHDPARHHVVRPRMPRPDGTISRNSGRKPTSTSSLR